MNGRKIRIDDLGIGQKLTFPFSQDKRLIQRLNGAAPMQALFEDPKTNAIVKGLTQLLDVLSFEESIVVDARRLRGPRSAPGFVP